jgi:hypothetical protein
MRSISWYLVRGVHVVDEVELRPQVHQLAARGAGSLRVAHRCAANTPPPQWALPPRPSDHTSAPTHAVRSYERPETIPIIRALPPTPSDHTSAPTHAVRSYERSHPRRPIIRTSGNYTDHTSAPTHAVRSYERPETIPIIRTSGNNTENKRRRRRRRRPGRMGGQWRKTPR